MREFAEFDRRPVIVAIAGPNGAGKIPELLPGYFGRIDEWH